MDEYFFPFQFNGNRAIVMGKKMYEGLIKKLKETIGEAAELTLYLAGYNMGTKAYKKDEIMGGRDAQRLISISKAYFKAKGYGKLQVEKLDLDGKKATLKIYDSFECSLFKDSKKPQSQLIRGMLVGWYTGFFKEEMKVTETRCIAKGDPYCQFEIQAKRE